MRAPQQTLNERIAGNLYSLVKPPPCDVNHPSVAAKPILDYESKGIGFMSGDIRRELIAIIGQVAAFNPVTAPKTERKKIDVLEASIRRMRRDISDLADPSPYMSLLTELGRTRPVSPAPVSRGRKEWLRLKLAAELVLDLMIDWGIGRISLHESGQFVRLTAKLFEIATGTKRGLSTAKRACAEVFDGRGLMRRRDIEPTPGLEWMTEEWWAEEKADQRALLCAEMEHWVPLSELLNEKGSKRSP